MPKRDLSARLQRPIPGEWAHGVRELESRLGERSNIQPRKDPVSEQRAPVEYRIKATRRRVEPGPYSPQIIRMMRHPSTLEVVRPRRVKADQRARPQPRERVQVGEMIRQARAISREATWERPTEVHPPLPDRPRIDVEAFLRSSPVDRGDR